MVYSIALHLADVPQIITAASTTVYTKSSQAYRQLTGLRHGDLVQPDITQKCAPLTLSLRHMLVDNVRFMIDWLSKAYVHTKPATEYGTGRCKSVQQTRPSNGFSTIWHRIPRTYRYDGFRGKKSVESELKQQQSETAHVRWGLWFA